MNNGGYNDGIIEGGFIPFTAAIFCCLVVDCFSLLFDISPPLAAELLACPLLPSALIPDFDN